MQNLTQVITRLPIEGVAVILVIAALMCVAILSATRAHNRLSQEARELDAFRSQRPPLSVSGAVEALAYRLDERPLRTAMRDAAGRGALRDEMLPYAEWNDLSRYLAGIFVFIGLSGTVLGIARALTNLGVAVTTASGAAAGSAGAESAGMSLQRWSKLLDGIDALLSGMQSASVCTFVGIFATIVVSLFNHWFQARCSTLIADAHRVAANYLSEAWRAARDGSSTAGLADAVAHLRDSTVELRNMVETSSDRVKEISGALQGFAEHTQSQADAIEKRIHTSAELLDGFSTRMEELEQKIAGGHQELQGSLRQASELLASGDGGLAKLVPSLTKACDALREGQGEMQSLSRAIQQAVTDANTTIANTLTNSTREATKEVRELREALGNAQGLQEKRFDELLKNLRDLHGRLKDILDSFERTLLDSTSPIDRSSSEQMRKQLGLVQEAVVRIEATVGGTTGSPPEKDVRQPPGGRKAQRPHDSHNGGDGVPQSTRKGPEPGTGGDRAPGGGTAWGASPPTSTVAPEPAPTVRQPPPATSTPGGTTPAPEALPTVSVEAPPETVAPASPAAITLRPRVTRPPQEPEPEPGMMAWLRRLFGGGRR